MSGPCKQASAKGHELEKRLDMRIHRSPNQASENTRYKEVLPAGVWLRGVTPAGHAHSPDFLASVLPVKLSAPTLQGAAAGAELWRLIFPKLLQMHCLGAWG